MKNIFFALILLSVNVFADESALVLSNETTKVETHAVANQSANVQPDWKFLIGQSSLNNDNYSSGNGLTFGAGYILNSQISFGGSFTKFKVNNTYVYDYGNGTTYSESYRDNLNYLTLHTEFTPIRYEIGQLGFSGSILMGASNSSSDFNSDTQTYLFYGASAALNINNQIGFSVDTKVSSQYSSLTSVSMIGYY